MNVQNIQSSGMSHVVQQHADQKVQREEYSRIASGATRGVQQLTTHSEEPLMNNEERKYFEELFPNATNEVRAYHAYRRDGTRVTFTTGTLIDRKG